MQTHAYPNEQRAHTRIPTSRPIVLMMGTQNLYGTLTDFSQSGLGFMCCANPSLNERVEVHFDIPETEKDNDSLHSFQFKAEVIHCINLQEENHIGVRLDLPTKEYLDVFEKLSTN